MISYVLPTRDRPQELDRTLHTLGSVDPHDGLVVVVDNASHQPLVLPHRLPNGLACVGLRLAVNRSSAARNEGVAHAANIAGLADDHWVVMLDDDSAPLHAGHVRVLRDAPRGVGAIAAEVFLPHASGNSMSHEAGGLPEVFTGCGAAIRARDFLELGGYDESFDYYAEEYDLCARLLLAGLRVVHDRRFQVLHRKVPAGRDQARIIANLARNNAWIMQRYAPESQRQARVEAQLARYEAIARKENVLPAFERAAQQARDALPHQPRRPLREDLWDRFTGLHAARAHLTREVSRFGLSGQRAWVVRAGKGSEEVTQAALDAGLRVVDTPVGTHASDGARLIGTLSPGVMLDAAALERATAGPLVLTSWDY